MGQHRIELQGQLGLHYAYERSAWVPAWRFSVAARCNAANAINDGEANNTRSEAYCASSKAYACLRTTSSILSLVCCADAMVAPCDGGFSSSSLNANSKPARLECGWCTKRLNCNVVKSVSSRSSTAFVRLVAASGPTIRRQSSDAAQRCSSDLQARYKHVVLSLVERQGGSIHSRASLIVNHHSRSIELMW